jgi:hypothetical protein
VLRFFEGGDCCFTPDCGKAPQEIFESFSALEVIEKGLDGHSGSPKNRASAENVAIFDNHVHDRIVSRGSTSPTVVPPAELWRKSCRRRGATLSGLWDGVRRHSAAHSAVFASSDRREWKERLAWLRHGKKLGRPYPN